MKWGLILEMRRVGKRLVMGDPDGAVVDLEPEPAAEMDDEALRQAIEAARRAADESRVRAIREAFEPTAT